MSSAPRLAPGFVMEQATDLAAPWLGVRELPAAFEDELLARLSRNPEGRALLERLKDRGGELRLPAFMLSRLLPGTGGFSFPLVDGVFFDRGSVGERGWSMEELLSDPAKQRRLAAELELVAFHELYHAAQFRAWMLPGQLEPGQLLLGLLTIEMEHEAYLAEMRYARASLERGLPVPAGERARYELYLDDFDGFLRGIGESGTYRAFRHTPAAYYREAVEAERERWRAGRAGGYELLAQRASRDGEYDRAYLLREKARAARL